MDGHTLRRHFVDFYRDHGHAIIGSGPLVPEHDRSVLFTTAGMHPLVPYLLGRPHPAGRRLANWQQCLRTNDIAEVGDTAHLTFFEMLGAWSLGDYWKLEALRMSYLFLTEQLGLDAARLYVTCFAGDDDALRDDESAAIWRSLGIPDQRICFLPKADNWWGPVGATGICGPDSEMFYDMRPGGPGGQTPATNPERFWEIGNNVFLEYDKQADGSYVPAPQRSVDLGLGFDRLLALVEGVPSPFETELFRPIVAAIRALALHPQPFALRVVADHARAAVFVLAAGVRPGNVAQAYVARRLIRRAVRYGRELGIEGPFLSRIAPEVIATLADGYPLLEERRAAICAALDDEESRFRSTLLRGEKELDRVIATSRRSGDTRLDGTDVFRLYETYGYPPELTEELAARQGLAVDMAGFQAAFATHQTRSRGGDANR